MRKFWYFIGWCIKQLDVFLISQLVAVGGFMGAIILVNYNYQPPATYFMYLSFAIISFWVFKFLIYDNIRQLWQKFNIEQKQMFDILSKGNNES